tara:strand:- start:458 stop:1033 length:576 start_codon:yes stop_codon:yes gene_type:complete
MLRAFGCSFTYGTSCINPTTDSWPVLLSKMLETDCENYGLSGASNDYIFKTISENIESFNKDDIIVVMMTQPNRRYFRQKNIMPNISGEVAKVYYKYINDDQGDYINFLQNFNAYHNILNNYKYLITFIDARPLLECNDYNLGAVARHNENTYIPKKLGLNRYIEEVDYLHPSNKGHQQIAQELYEGYFNV